MFKKWKEARQLRFENKVKSLLGKIKEEKDVLLTSESKPYVFKVRNTSNEKQSVNVFGFNQNYKKMNFGNPDCIEFTNMQGAYGLDFDSLFATTATKPFIVGKLRIESSTQSMLKKIIGNVNIESNGYGVETPINLSVQKDAYQFQSDILDINMNILVDSDTVLRFEIEPNSEINICMFPIAQFNPRMFFNQFFTTKRLSAKYAAAVTIETKCQCENGKCEKGCKLNFFQKVKKFFIELKAKVKQKVSQLKNK